MYDKLIFHVDVNSAFLSWEAAYRIHILGEISDLRDIPSAVGGDIKKRHGIILAKSTPAKKYGIQTGMTLSEALTKCSNLTVVPPHYDLYDQCSKKLLYILNQYAPIIEQYSIDEAFLDLTGTSYLHKNPIKLANEIRERIYSELGFTVNIGISTNRLLAKMASDFKKPNLVHTLFPEEIPSKMWPLPIRDLFFVGRATEKKLLSLGILTIGDLAQTDLSILKSHLKKHGEVIHSYANGIDATPIASTAPVNKGYGNSITIPYDITNYENARLVLLSLCETVSTRLRSHNVQIQLVSVELKDCNFNYYSHQRKLLSTTNITNEIFKTSCGLFKELWDGVTPIRQLGVRTSLVTDTAIRQLNLFDMNKYEKLAKLDQTVDNIRLKYGDNSIMRASFLDGNINHMSGGISPEKKKPTADGMILDNFAHKF
ncbi:DNA polymerase Y family protein [Anaeromicropila herbilytica]|uniref:DNA polymerase IV n=1 Tax=Anaeromicropila herbilytica TaxID=2785025 RepID=A0A7R7ID35_9FIRM|nr:DNA polymerase IV [Anaeromicropila herbilytica]BCN29618.1 DNA polymerase IV [Anaeromicropila herbilytica]